MVVVVIGLFGELFGFREVCWFCRFVVSILLVAGILPIDFPIFPSNRQRSHCLCSQLGRFIIRSFFLYTPVRSTSTTTTTTTTLHLLPPRPNLPPRPRPRPRIPSLHPSPQPLIPRHLLLHLPTPLPPPLLQSHRRPRRQRRRRRRRSSRRSRTRQRRTLRLQLRARVVVFAQSPFPDVCFGDGPGGLEARTAGAGCCSCGGLEGPVVADDVADVAFCFADGGVPGFGGGHFLFFLAFWLL